MNTTTDTGMAAAQLIADGLEVNAEIALEEPECPQGVDEDVLRLVRKHGLREVLSAIHCAAWGAAEVHEDVDEPEDMRSFRIRIFNNRLAEAIQALK
jgi:hypothetical protein